MFIWDEPPRGRLSFGENRLIGSIQLDDPNHPPHPPSANRSTREIRSPNAGQPPARAVRPNPSLQSVRTYTRVKRRDAQLCSGRHTRRFTSTTSAAITATPAMVSAALPLAVAAAM